MLPRRPTYCLYVVSVMYKLIRLVVDKNVDFFVEMMYIVECVCQQRSESPFVTFLSNCQLRLVDPSRSFEGRYYFSIIMYLFN